MIFSISKKLILAFLGLTLVVVISTLGLARWSFEQGFLDYVNALEEARLQLLTTSLSREYRGAGNSWSTLTEQRFEALLWEYAPENPDEQRSSGRPPPPGFMLPPPESPSSGLSSPSPPGEGPPRPGPPGEGPSRPGPPGEAPPRLGPPTALYSETGKLIAGIVPPPDDIKPIKVPIIVDGEPVGELRSAPRRQFTSPQETAFSRQQWITSALIGLVSLLLAIVFSLFLTRVLLAPIRRTISGISRLSNGDYTTRLNERRSDELGRLMGDLDRLAHKLEENRASRQRWLADISHELRTPLTVLTGEIEAMKDGIRPLDMQQVHSLDQEVTRLRCLIDDLYALSISDIGGLRYTFGPVDIQQSVSAAVEAVVMRANEQDIEIKMIGEIDKMIRADSQRLDQLFVNLLQNALAYTDSPGRIEVSLTSTRDSIVIRIDDTPPGVNEDECEKLFEPLYRHEISRSRHTAGAGLGLAISRNIVDAHQGTITASPSELGGLCIQLVFPTISEN